MTGTMPSNGEVNGEISTVSGKYTIPMGFHDGAGGVTIAATEQLQLVPTNIREGVTVLGVKGSMSGSEGMKQQAKTVTPSFEQLRLCCPIKRITACLKLLCRRPGHIR